MDENESVVYCADLQPMSDGQLAAYFCTLPRDHDGDHAAEDLELDLIYAVWRREN